MRPEGASYASKVIPCSCVTVAAITAKSAAAKVKPVCSNIPFNTRGNGAAYQDAKFGKGNRLHNAMVKDGKFKGHTCTVCGSRKAA